MRLIFLFCIVTHLLQALSWQVTHLSGPDICKHSAQERDQILANTTLQKKQNGSVLASSLVFAHLGTPGDEAFTQIVKDKCLDTTRPVHLSLPHPMLKMWSMEILAAAMPVKDFPGLDRS